MSIPACFNVAWVSIVEYAYLEDLGLCPIVQFKAMITIYRKI
jgi:hypothetical protein